MGAGFGSDAKVVGRYAVFHEIASGGMATVYFGRLKGDGGFLRTVAIKRLHSQFAKDADFVAMLLDEARLAARISHPNVVPTLDVVSVDGDLFLVLDYVHGETVARLQRALSVRNERVPPAIAACVTVGALHGLHAAHEARDEQGAPLGIVHRDVSPQNILVGTDGVPRVLDFGIAKAMGRLQTTQDGQLKGKMAYIPPEQIAGEAVSRLADVYAAGVVLWELLTGKRLFAADHEAAVLRKVLHDKVSAPSDVEPSVPKAFDAIVLRALLRDPRSRFQTAREMAIALERGVFLAPASEVGEWVEATATDALRRRAEQIAEIKRRTPSSIAEATRLVASMQGRSGRPGPEDPSTVSVSPSGHRATISSTPDPLVDRTPSSVAKKRAQRRILVIDDSAAILARVQRALSAEGYDVITTTQAVGNARHVPSCDLVIIDFHMPGIDGGTVISSLRAAAAKSDHSCLFYLFTSDEAVANQYWKMGFDGSFSAKGDEVALVRQVKALFRIVDMRAISAKPKPKT